MTGFDKTWLALREPVDARSLSPLLLTGAVEIAAEMSADAILDIGCGTGSSYRRLAPLVTGRPRWRLVDSDRALLDEARRHHGEDVELIEGDVNDVEALPLTDVGLVTASALFDLCSEDFVRRLVQSLSGARVSLYAPLNYDGEMVWSEPHPLDQAITAAFNAHQLGDKGLGAALGPMAWKTLARHLRGSGYEVRVESSPWLLTCADIRLQHRLLDGVAKAVSEHGELDEDAVAEWTGFRYRVMTREDSLCRIGHQDILAYS